MLSGYLDFCSSLRNTYRAEALRHGHDIAPRGGGRLRRHHGLHRADEQARAMAEDMTWFWSQWSQQFDQRLPLLLVGSPDTISRQIEAALKRILVNECFLLIP